MAQLNLLPRGPLDEATGPFAAEDLPAANPAAILADLIDLRGGVALAEQLATLDDLPTPDPEADPAALRSRIHDEIRVIWERLDAALTHAFKPRYRLPDAQRMGFTLRRGGAFDAPGAATLRSAARASWSPFNEFLEMHLKRARFALRDLRVEVGEALPRLSLDAARLERLDAALGQATHGAAEKLYGRALYAAERAYAEGLRAALAEHPAPDVDTLAAWLGEAGWVRPIFADAVALVRAMVRHERRRLEALVEAGCATVTRR